MDAKMEARKQAYWLGFRTRVRRYYQSLSEGRTHPSLLARLQGYAEAGLFSGMATKAELRKAVDLVHLSVYGITLVERRREASDSGEGDGAITYLDWAFWEEGDG